MALEPSSPVSELLLHWGNGDRNALEAILPLVYNELRRLARLQLQQQRPNHTLQTTGLVHEAYLRLAEEKSLHVKDRAHFLGIAAQLMRWILADEDTSEFLGVSPATVKRSWASARAWLLREMSRGEARA